jgi:hypothetical protein
METASLLRFLALIAVSLAAVVVAFIRIAHHGGRPPPPPTSLT